MAGDLVAGGSGDVAVEDGDVVGVGAQQLQRRVTVPGDVGGDGLQAQPVTDGPGQQGLVLDDQHPHQAMLVSGTYRRRIRIRRRGGNTAAR